LKDFDKTFGWSDLNTCGVVGESACARRRRRRVRELQ
jgi:hypothetical protein